MKITKYEKISMLIALIAIILSSLLTWYIFYYSNVRKKEHLSVVPIMFNATYDDKSCDYEVSVAFVNRGNVDVIVNAFGITIWLPLTVQETPAVIAGGHQGGNLGKSAIILKPGEGEIVSAKMSDVWRGHGFEYVIPAANTRRAQARVLFGYHVLSLEGELIRRSINIKTNNNRTGFSMLEIQSPMNETFDGPGAPAAPVILEYKLN